MWLAPCDRAYSRLEAVAAQCCCLPRPENLDHTVLLLPAAWKLVAKWYFNFAAVGLIAYLVAKLLGADVFQASS